MKKIFKICAAILLAAAFSISLCGCNKQLVDFTFKYDTAIIDMYDGTTITVEIENWTDYADGDQIQIKTKDGQSYLVHSSHCILIAG